jgi:hypothetical protein
MIIACGVARAPERSRPTNLIHHLSEVIVLGRHGVVSALASLRLQKLLEDAAGSSGLLGIDFLCIDRTPMSEPGGGRTGIRDQAPSCQAAATALHSLPSTLCYKYEVPASTAPEGDQGRRLEHATSMDIYIVGTGK